MSCEYSTEPGYAAGPYWAMYRVFVEGLEFYAYHGVSAEERKIGHRYLADLTLEVEGKADVSDRVQDTVDYGLVAQFLVDEALGRQFSTLEALATSLARSVLDRFRLVESVELRLAKPLPPAPVIANAAGVEVSLSR